MMHGNDEMPIDLMPAQSTQQLNPLFRIMAGKLSALKYGHLTVTLPDGSQHHFGETGKYAAVTLHSWRPLTRLLMHGDLGFAESYMEGDWNSPDLTALFDIALQNADLFSLENRGNWLYRLRNRFLHMMNNNSRRGSRKNIAYHYDLGNDFYRLWLDESMTYSSAWFDGSEGLAAAQQKKYHMIADMADIQPGQDVLEIGCGWGGFSEIAARDYDCRITGLTLSQEQHDWANRRYQDTGLAHLALAELCDYRDSTGQYDRIVSIEMFEAVGVDNWDSYFSTLKSRLKPGGIALLQVILIEDERYEDYKNNVDFIQKYIFPGGFLPSPSTFEKEVQRQGLKLQESRFFGQSYARTCAIWQQNFQREWPAIRTQGFDTRFKKMWEYYLSYCESGFRAGTISVGLFKITAPNQA